jgi:hypothetical protein
MTKGARGVLWGGLALLAVCWQCSVWAIVPVLGLRLDAVLVLAIAAGWYWGPLAGACFGLALGALLDGVCGTGLHHGVSKTLVGLLTGWSRRTLDHLDPWVIGLLVVVPTLVDALCLAALWRLSGHTWAWERAMSHALPLGLVHAGLWLVLQRFERPGELQP